MTSTYSSPGYPSFTVRVENTENVTAVDERLVDIGDQARQFCFDLTALFLDDIADLLVFAEVDDYCDHGNKCRDDRSEKQKRNSKYTNEKCFNDSVCHVLFGRHTHIRTFKVDLELESLILVHVPERSEL